MAIALIGSRMRQQMSAQLHHITALVGIVLEPDAIVEKSADALWSAREHGTQHFLKSSDHPSQHILSYFLGR
ncbi:hypothetical protein ERJ75_001583400 [Trypanosoma vivax]|nr:hypothetical protein ERJ75_001583400 [Trypanosoma vivax]